MYLTLIKKCVKKMVLENLNMVRGGDIVICDGITIRQPVLGEIEE